MRVLLSLRVSAWVAALVSSLTVVPLAAAELRGPNEHVDATLVADRNGISPGASLTIGLRLRHHPKWHTYWQVPGDSGLPTQLIWKLPAGFKAGPLEWPVPQRLPVGPLMNFGYDGDVVLLTQITAPTLLRAEAGQKVQLKARANWLVCNDVCIPGGADLMLDLPVRSASAVQPSEHTALISAQRRRVPPARNFERLTVTRQDARLEISLPPPEGRVPAVLEFFPLEASRIEAAAAQPLALRAGSSAGSTGETLALQLTAAAPVAADFKLLRGVLVADGGPDNGGGWAASIDAPIVSGTVIAAAVANVATNSGAAGLAASSATTVSEREPVVPTAEQLAGVGAVAAVGVDRADRATANALQSPPTSDARSKGTVAAGGGALAHAGAATGWLAALMGAFIGGLILNLMPCVFPVLSLKLLNLLSHGGGAARAHVGVMGATGATGATGMGSAGKASVPPRLYRHGLAFTAGVTFTFVALAAALIALQSAGQRLGWGFQLQSPQVVAALVALFFVIGLNLLGTFEWTLGSAVANIRVAQRADRSGGLPGSVATGVLAVVVAAPCTAPFMGAALGFAATQPPAISLTVFVALGMGMAAPYLLLTIFPGLLARLPRPGAWMERFRQVMAFPMFATCIWLLWVLGQQSDIHALTELLLALLVIAVAGWAWGQHQRGAHAWRWVALVAAMGGGYALFVAADAADASAREAVAAQMRGGRVVGGMGGKAGESASAGWAVWSPARVRELTVAGRPVFVDFTAAWCVTCQVNKRLVLGRPEVVQAFDSRGVTRLRADWTQRDDVITAELARFGRNGVPMYVLFDASGKAVLLPEVLTEQVVIAALVSLKPAGAP